MDDLKDGKDIESGNERPGRMQAILHFILGLLFFLGCLMVLGGLSIGLFSYFLNGSLEGISNTEGLMQQLAKMPLLLKIFLFLSSSLPLILSVWLTLNYIKASPKKYLLLHFPGELKWFLLAIVFVLISMPLMDPLLELNKLLDLSQWPDFQKWLVTQDNANNKTYEAMVGDRSSISFLWSVLFMAILPALAEEIFFRGFLMNVFNGIFRNMHVAIFISALIFSLLHFQFMKIIPMIFLATVFGYAAYWSGTLWTSITAHFLNNLMAVYMLYFVADGDYTKVIENNEGMPVLISLAIASIVIGLFIYVERFSTTKTKNFYVES
jgi:membrane protease YdiL (CAAX protease family)